jgi:leader peptidase (prepilin peptidase)/N-methyltransferase
MRAVTVFLSIASFVFGAVVGSFLNVCIHRIPRGESIIRPRSRCPSCGVAISAFDNIPLLSYLLLRARCRSCGASISAVYPAVELLTAVLSLVLFRKFGLSLPFLASFAFCCALVTVTFVDLEHRIIPDVISLPGIPVFAVCGVGIMGLPLMDSVIGIVLGGGVLYLVAAGYELLKKQEGMGGGDIKLLAMIGGFLGWKSLLFVLLVSSLLGAFVGISVMVYRKGNLQDAVPFGPFLSAAAVLHIFYGEAFFRFLIVR